MARTRYVLSEVRKIDTEPKKELENHPAFEAIGPYEKTPLYWELKNGTVIVCREYAVYALLSKQRQKFEEFKIDLPNLDRHYEQYRINKTIRECLNK